MNKGILYGVGVGPGDPELLTFKAARILRGADVVAVPETGEGRRVALTIAQAHVRGKQIVECPMPMLRDKQKLARNYDRVADMLVSLLDEGKTVAFLTLGDPSVYSTYAYLHRRVLVRGYDARLVPGVPSFCAVAAALNRPLCEGNELLHIVPAAHDSTDLGLSLPGNKVLMKAGRAAGEVCDKLRQAGRLRQAALVENCGMESEKVYTDLEAFDGEAGYFSVIVVKEGN